MYKPVSYKFAPMDVSEHGKTIKTQHNILKHITNKHNTTIHFSSLHPVKQHITESTIIIIILDPHTDDDK